MTRKHFPREALWSALAAFIAALAIALPVAVALTSQERHAAQARITANCRAIDAVVTGIRSFLRDDARARQEDAATKLSFAGAIDALGHRTGSDLTALSSIFRQSASQDNGHANYWLGGDVTGVIAPLAGCGP